ncbi:hypothetical protein [Aeromicrobium sp. UC242_57]|uniref:hypothetical protein n=1 Tax=Aeromicrobium sp. UC242_57 TaxID=3374624 RepID=UPI0037A72CBF
MLNAAFELAEARGVRVASLADELRWKPRRVRQLLGELDDSRPQLQIIRVSSDGPQATSEGHRTFGAF